jgi:hypothetical protein
LAEIGTVISFCHVAFVQFEQGRAKKALSPISPLFAGAGGGFSSNRRTPWIGLHTAREITLNVIAIALHPLIAMIGLEATQKAIGMVPAPGF